MKKFLFCFLSILLIGFSAETLAIAAEIRLQTNVDQSSRQVTISGITTAGAYRQVTVLVQAPDGAIDYIDQTSSDENGFFEFTYFLNVGKTGTYKVRAGGTGIDNVAVTTFEYSAETPSSPHPGNIVTPVDEPDTVQATEKGARIVPGKSSISETTDDEGNTVVTYTLDYETFVRALDKLDSSGQEEQTIEIVIETEQKTNIILPGEIVKAAIDTGKEMILAVRNHEGYYNLPIIMLQDAVTDQAFILVTIGPAYDALQTRIRSLLGNAAVLIKAMEYEVEVVQDGNKVLISDFGNIFVERGFLLSQSVDDPDSATVVLYDPEKDELMFVPSLFQENDSLTVVVVKRTGNSAYAVVEHEKTFEDIQGHWAEHEIELLASKYIISGISDTMFAPSEMLTRAQFAALIVRALGLSDRQGEVSFRDVDQRAWYAGAVAAANEVGIVAGYPDETFRPSDPITREQLMVMLARALEFAGKSPGVSENDVLEQYRDSNQISAWAVSGVAASVNAGIVKGITPDTLGPDRNVTRAEAAVMIKRALKYLEFIN